MEQERHEGWIMGEVDKGVPLPGLYPMNAETTTAHTKAAIIGAVIDDQGTSAICGPVNSRIGIEPNKVA